MQSITAKELQRRFGTYLANVRRGDSYAIEHYGAVVARLIPAREEDMSEDQADYTTETPDFDQLLREDLAGFLAFNAYHQEHGDKQAAVRALAEAILKVQALP